MPNLPSHMHLAAAAQERLRIRLLDEFRGAFLLGSTAPDMRMLLRTQRDSTHFAPLEFREVGEGVRGLLEAHPECASAKTTGATRAFVAGYLTHLVADEMWIVKVYRPFFGDRGLIPAEREANLWDRAVQLDMDRTAWEALPDKGSLQAALATADGGVELSFIDPERLAEWKQVVLGFAQRGFSWERLWNTVRRMYGEEVSEARGAAEEFLKGLPRTLETIYAAVPRAAVRRFWDDSLDAIVDTVGGYLATERGARPR